jgi:prepilin-type N-terminal cleavage/methylation domain-containing protein
MRNDSGFSLIELLIVVAIILIIAAIAIPSFLQAKIAANESSASASIRNITTAEIAYNQAYPATGYATSITELGSAGVIPCVPSAASACLIDDSLATATVAPGKSGYIFAATGIPQGAANVDFVAGAAPVALGTSGTRKVCSTTDGVMRYLPNAGGGPVTTVATCQTYPIAR